MALESEPELVHLLAEYMSIARRIAIMTVGENQWRRKARILGWHVLVAWPVHASLYGSFALLALRLACEDGRAGSLSTQSSNTRRSTVALPNLSHPRKRT